MRAYQRYQYGGGARIPSFHPLLRPLTFRRAIILRAFSQPSLTFANVGRGHATPFSVIFPPNYHSSQPLPPSQFLLSLLLRLSIRRTKPPDIVHVEIETISIWKRTIRIYLFIYFSFFLSFFRQEMRNKLIGEEIYAPFPRFLPGILRYFSRTMLSKWKYRTKTDSSSLFTGFQRDLTRFGKNVRIDPFPGR